MGKFLFFLDIFLVFLILVYFIYNFLFYITSSLDDFFEIITAIYIESISFR
jgi:hypothetical protein